MSALPERTSQSYGPAITGASKAVLLELAATLRSYKDALVLVGGWAPYLLLAAQQRAGGFQHVGSIDIDLAVDPSAVREPEYATIVELLRERGYVPAEGRRGGGIPHSLARQVLSPVTNKQYTIRVDFLTQPDDAPGKHQPVQDDLFARKVKGCEAAFAHQRIVQISGTLPDGGMITLPIRMADLTAILTMKGIVLGERYREKDAYDIYALLRHYGRGPAEAAEAIRPHRADPLIQEATANLRSAFASRDAHGPAWVAAFITSPVFGAERERVATDAFMVVSEFLRLVSA